MMAKHRVRIEAEEYMIDDHKITKGTSADALLILMPKVKFVRRPKVLGKDNDGIVVEWHYRDVVFTLARAKTLNEEGEVTYDVYAVQKIEVREANVDRPEEQDNN